MAVEALVRRFGDGDLIACSALQPDMLRFETSFGAIVYRRAFGMDVTLGGPLCAPGDRLAMIERFLRARRRPVLCYLRGDLMRLVGDGSSRAGDLHAAGMGVDREVDVDALVERPPKAVRGALKHARRADVRLEPVDLRSIDGPLRARLREINDRYLARAECTIEMSFINQPMRYVHDGLRRVFVLREGGAPLGFAVLNPIFREGAVTGYLLDILRFERTRVWGVWLSTVHALASRLRGEGLGLSVGFAPLHRVRHPPRRSRLLSVQIDGMARLLGSAQYLRRLRELKDLVPGRDEPRYFASCSRSALTNLFALMEVSGVGFRYLFGPDLVKVLREGLRA